MTEPLYKVTRGGNRRRLRKLTRRQKARLRFAVYTRDGFTCQAEGCTRRAIPPEGWDGSYALGSEPTPGCPGRSLDLDHIIPYSAGGPDTEDNIRTMCEPCNCSRGAKVDG